MLDDRPIPQPLERPLAATIIGWLWILLSAAGLIEGIKSFFTARKLAALRTTVDENENAKMIVDKFADMLGGTPVELVIVVVCSAITFAGAIGLLKLRAWGRWIIIGATWLTLIGNIIVQPIMIWQMTNFVNLGGQSNGFFVVMMWGIGLFGIAFNLVIVGLMLRHLHSQRLRDAIRARNAMPLNT